EQCPVVAPPVRVTDLRRERLELGEGRIAGCRAHPVERGEVAAEGLDEVADEIEHRRLGVRWEMFRDVELADRLPERLLDERDTALPRLTQLGNPRQGPAVEVEALLDERARQVCRARANDV